MTGKSSAIEGRSAKLHDGTYPIIQRGQCARRGGDLGSCKARMEQQGREYEEARHAEGRADGGSEEKIYGAQKLCSSIEIPYKRIFPLPKDLP
jgi:hypothetical protein